MFANFIIGMLVGIGIGMFILGLCASSSRADIEHELLITREKMRKILRGELPNLDI